MIIKKSSGLRIMKKIHFVNTQEKIKNLREAYSEHFILKIRRISEGEYAILLDTLDMMFDD